MLSNINNLMDSENYLLENYFELKVYYLQEQTIDYQEFENKLLESLEQNEVVFNKIALEAMTTFEEDDPKFLEEFSDLLIVDVCELTQQYFVEWEVEKCFNEMHNKMLEEGLMSAMTYFQRIVYQAVFDLKKTGVEPEEYFKKKRFEDLDDYIIYMFKLYQATQARMNDGLVKTLNSRIDFLLILFALEISILLASLSAWLLEEK